MPTRGTYLPVQQPDFNPKGVRDKIRGGALATKPTRDAALYTQTQCAIHGARILCRVGLQGQPSTLVVSGINPEGGDVQTYPLATAERIMARQRVRLTPGYVISWKALTLPTGPTQQFAPGFGWIEGTPNGALRVDILITNGFDQKESTKTITPTSSNLEYRGLPTATGSCWGVLQEHGPFSPLVSDDPRFTEGVTADIVIRAIGGVRPVDVVVYEEPGAAPYHETFREGTFPSFPPEGAGSEYPLTGYSYPGNPTRGSHQANKTILDQRGILGPQLLHWSCWNEDVAPVNATEGTPIIVNQIAFRELQTTTMTAYGSGNPGWSVSSGAYGRNLEQSGPLELRDVNGCIPVTVRAYARVTSAAHTGTIRFQTESYSYRDLTVTGSTAWAWYSGLAWLRVPVHASLDSLLQVFAKVGGAAHQLEVRYLSAEFGGHHAVVQ